MVWLNIEMEIKQLTYHSRDDCEIVQKREETQSGDEEASGKGGEWLEFSDLTEVIDYYKEKYPEFAIFQHC